MNEGERLRQQIREVFEHQPLGTVDAKALAEALADSHFDHRRLEEIEAIVRQVAISTGEPLADPPTDH